MINNSANNKRRVFVLLLLLFTCAFVMPLMIFKVPLQYDDIMYYITLVGDDIALQQLYDFIRLPANGLATYYSFKLLPLVSNDVTINPILFMLSGIHLACSFLLFLLVRSILALYYSGHEDDARVSSISFLASALFLLSPIATDAYPVISFMVRDIGMLFVILNLILKLKYFRQPGIPYFLPKVLLTAAIMLAAVFFYEPYLVYLFAGYILIVYAKDIKKAFFYIVAETVIIACVIATRMLMTWNNITDRGIDLQSGTVIKKMFLYLISIIVPNFHGLILLGTPLFFLIFLLLMANVLIKRDNYKRSSWLILGCGALLIMIIAGLSLNPYYAPRALYLAAPVLSIVFALLLYGLQNNYLRSAAISLVLLSCVISFWHFYYVQNQGYIFWNKLKEAIISVNKMNDNSARTIDVSNLPTSGIRFFAIPDSGSMDGGSMVKVLSLLSGDKGMNANVRLNFAPRTIDPMNSDFSMIKLRLGELFFQKDIRIKIL